MAGCLYFYRGNKGVQKGLCRTTGGQQAWKILPRKRVIIIISNSNPFAFLVQQS